MNPVSHAWFPRSSCGTSCVRTDDGDRGRAKWRSVVRTSLVLLLFPVIPLLAVPVPGQTHVQRTYCRLMLRCLGVRIAMSGGPIRNLRGVLVVGNHISWLDVFVVGAVMPGAFVTRADVTNWPAIGTFARLLRMIPIERTSLRKLPGVVAEVATRLREGQTVVAFPEGTTFCGIGHGRFRPAMFQAAIDAARPVQPLRLTYYHRDGSCSTVPAFVGEDEFGQSFRRVVSARRTVAHLGVEALQLPGTDRRELAQRCHQLVCGDSGCHGAPQHRPALAA